MNPARYTPESSYSRYPQSSQDQQQQQQQQSPQQAQNRVAYPYAYPSLPPPHTHLQAPHLQGAPQLSQEQQPYQSQEIPTSMATMQAPGPIMMYGHHPADPVLHQPHSSSLRHEPHHQAQPIYHPAGTGVQPLMESAENLQAAIQAQYMNKSDTTWNADVYNQYPSLRGTVQATPGMLGQVMLADHKPRVTTTVWEDEDTLCFQVEIKGICVARRADNNMINGTKLLNVAGMTRGRRDGILKSEKVRHVVKIGTMYLKGVWIPYERAIDFATREKIVDVLYPLFVANIEVFLYHPTNYTQTLQMVAAATRKRQVQQYRYQQEQQRRQAQHSQMGWDPSHYQQQVGVSSQYNYPPVTEMGPSGLPVPAPSAQQPTRMMMAPLPQGQYMYPESSYARQESQVKSLPQPSHLPYAGPSHRESHNEQLQGHSHTQSPLGIIPQHQQSSEGPGSSSVLPPWNDDRLSSQKPAHEQHQTSSSEKRTSPLSEHEQR